jgi:flagellar basal body P-ring formation protein FlgA
MNSFLRQALDVGACACALALLFSSPIATTAGSEPSKQDHLWQLRASAMVDSAGIYLDQVATSPAAETIPHLRLGAAPAVGQVAVLSVSQVSAALRGHLPDLFETAWSGAKAVRVVRRMRTLEEGEILQMLAATLQQDVVKDRGELEIHLTRPWAPLQVPDELLSLSILDLPTAGVTQNFIVRFALRAGTEPFGAWQWPLRAKVWREMCVARTALTRGDPLSSAELTLERRDVLGLREAPIALAAVNPSLEMAENVMAGAPLYKRSVRLRAVVHRGKILDAVVQEGALMISVRAEVLEDGVIGQIVRARNLNSKREFRGKVQNEQELLVSL